MSNIHELPIAEVVTSQHLEATCVSSSSSPTNREEAGIIKELSTSKDLPHGLIKILIESSKTCAIRYWIVDNSGSMGYRDGKKYIRGDGSSMKTVRCSRWEELSESLKWHGETAITLKAHTEFRLLNSPYGSKQRVVLGSNDYNHTMADLNEMISTTPSGGTPLCSSINQIVHEIKTMENVLRASNKTVSITIATDGASSDGDVSKALKPLIHLPCSVVVRLCTDENHIVEYWNNIDNDLEIELDVLDDVQGEAKEVCSSNRWLSYTESLHRVREWGNVPKLFDLLDERKLSLSETQQFIAYILGNDMVANLPNIQLDEEGYRTGLTALLTDYPKVYDAFSGNMKPMFDASALSATSPLSDAPKKFETFLAILIFLFAVLYIAVF